MGISFDTPAENQAFAEAMGFSYRLLSDEDRKVGVAYHAAREGLDLSPFPRRISYLIDPEGKIVKGYKVTDILGHPEEMLRELESARAG